MVVAWTVRSRWFAAEAHWSISIDQAMNADPRTLGWLNRALNHELSAVQQYQAQSVLARIWGEAPLSEQLQREVVEELRHAQRLMEHLIVLGVAPQRWQFVAGKTGQDGGSTFAGESTDGTRGCSPLPRGPDTRQPGS